MPNTYSKLALSSFSLFFAATVPETRQCPYVGKFSVHSLIRRERRVRSPIHNHQLEMHHFRQNYHLDKHSKIFYGEVGHVIRTKRVDRLSDCDNEGFSNLIVGCSSADTMEFRSECPSPDFISCKSILLLYRYLFSFRFI